MIEKIQNIKKNHVAISLITASLAVFLAWGIFIAQYFFSDTVTLARHDDEARYLLPVFIETGEHISNGIIDGVDTLTVNGSNSIHTDNLEWYLPYRFFTYLGNLTSPLFMYMAFLTLHMFLNMYFTQRLCHVYFKMRPSLALLIAVSNISLSCSAVWFNVFFVIMSLVMPLIYNIIYMLKRSNMLICLLSSFFYVLAFTSGYILISSILALTVFLFTLSYAILYKINTMKNIIRYSLIPAILGVGICLPYYYNIFHLNTENHNARNMMTLSGSLVGSSQATTAIPGIFFNSNDTAIKEWIFCIGMIWTYLIIFFICDKTAREMKAKEKIICGSGIICTLLCFFTELRNVLPFEKWFYMIPIIGGMHYRRRFLLIFIPLLFLSFGMILQKSKEKPKKNTIICISVIYALLIFFLYHLAIESINQDIFLIELLLTGITLYFGLTSGFLSKKFLLVFSCVIFCYGVNSLYIKEEVTVSGSVIKNRSIAFDAEKQVMLDNFIDSFPKQHIYKYVALEGLNREIPLYIPGNYGWYHRQKNILSNYLRYPLHGGSLTDAYLNAFNVEWYNSFDINYLYDTRADFAVLTNEIKDKTPINFVFDSSVTPLYFNDTMFCAKLEKYIPRHYTNGKELVLDKNNSLDNGFFYCPTLTNNNIENFKTDNYTYFKISINADIGSELQYSMFPNEKFSYYIDGKKYEPVKDYNLAYFNLTPGHHTIEIIYQDTKQIVIYWTFTIYYSLILLGGICLIIGYWRKRRAK